MYSNFLGCKKYQNSMRFSVCLFGPVGKFTEMNQWVIMCWLCDGSESITSEHATIVGYASYILW